MIAIFAKNIAGRHACMKHCVDMGKGFGTLATGYMAFIL